ncbi:FAD-dependent oxidoreductase [Roseococcus sp.]|uniref:FAD-dependent oxidoreductase n=1 Tax=Roseococcus sp. TaxID=2109646 RepID=UPI003BAB0DD5
MIRPFSPDLDRSHHDVCVIGAGPAGIALALELARLGHSVLLAESGQEKPTPQAQALAEAQIADPARHAPMAIAVQRSLGGAGNLWGGRCVPLDPLDFEDRPEVSPLARWPITAADLAPFLDRAADYADIGTADFDRPVPGVAASDPDFTFHRLERWCREPRLQLVHDRRLRTEPQLDLRLGATLAALRFSAAGRVEAAILQGPDGQRATVHAGRFVLACGGIENARLLLNAQDDPENGDPQRFGGPEGWVGRCYMGHLYGTIASIQLATEALDAALDYEQVGQGVFGRRRFNPSAELVGRENLLNTAIWPEFPPIHDPGHGSGLLSAAFLALSVAPLGRLVVGESIRRSYIGTGPLRLMRHLRNVALDVTNTATFIPRFLWRRKIAKPRHPGFFQRNAARRYSLRYHAEATPDPESRITLGEERDATGLRRARIDLRFSPADIQALIRAHALFGAWLERTGLGRMEWAAPEAELAALALAQCTDGHHQIGTTRMADSPATGVVDRDALVFGTGNLYVAGASVFPTSGQANPTFPAIALAVRLADHLALTLARR